MSSDQGEASGPGQASHQLDQAELGGERNLLPHKIKVLDLSRSKQNLEHGYLDL